MLIQPAYEILCQMEEDIIIERSLRPGSRTIVFTCFSICTISNVFFERFRIRKKSKEILISLLTKDISYDNIHIGFT